MNELSLPYTVGSCAPRIFTAARPYMRVRKNDVHIPLSYDYALRLLQHYPQANAEVTEVAIILHDIGWYSIDAEDIIQKGFRSENFLQSDVRYLHESEGVRLATDLLTDLGYDSDFIHHVTHIIDGHDTRTFARSLEDEIVRDADKLWRFDIPGISIACDWFNQTPAQYANRLASDVVPQLHLPESKSMALDALKTAQRQLQTHVL